MSFFEQVCAGTDNDGVDEEVKLIEQPVLEQKANQSAAGLDVDVLAWLLLERVDLRCDVAGDQCRRTPVGGCDRAGDKDFGSGS